MCTVSWLLNELGYDVFFNRDEQKSRSIALPPEINKINQINCLMPIDPDGRGSWIATNEYGLSLCLLNFYQNGWTKSSLKSRGLLVKELSCLCTIDDVIEMLNLLDMSCYAPFSLLLFSSDLTLTSGQIINFQWDGKLLSQKLSESPVISSSILFQDVLLERQQTYLSIMSHCPSIEKAWLYHASHMPHKGSMSVCMHRTDASTVSFTHLSVRCDEINMIYVEGAPCQQNKKQVSVLKKKKRFSFNNCLDIAD